MAIDHLFKYVLSEAIVSLPEFNLEEILINKIYPYLIVFIHTAVS